MANRKLCGYDVNGWRDGVARNWVARPGDEEEIGVVRVVEGAVLPDVVLSGEGSLQRWIGGAQAVLAPHGRGGGWGKFGDPQLRQSIRSLIADETKPSSVLAAAFTGLAQGASHSVAAIADTATTTEQLQERVFAALNTARAGKALLVWRSVLSVLYAIQKGNLQAWMRDGAQIGIIGHVESGFSFQTLRLRAMLNPHWDMRDLSARRWRKSLHWLLTAVQIISALHERSVGLRSDCSRFRNRCERRTATGTSCTRLMSCGHPS